MARNAVFTVYSKIIGPYPAGQYMGLMLASGCLSRALTPFWAIHLMQISIKWCALACSGGLIIGSILVIINWEHCSPHQQNINSNLIIIDFNRADTLHDRLIFDNSFN